jgi:hypothetical protein
MTYEQAKKNEARQAWEELSRHYGAGVAVATPFDELHPARRHWLIAVTFHLRTLAGSRTV